MTISWWTASSCSALHNAAPRCACEWTSAYDAIITTGARTGQVCQSVSSLLEMLEVRVAGYAIYHAAASRKWCVVEIPENWTREEVLPL